MPANPAPEHLELQRTVAAGEVAMAADFVARHTGLSKAAVKDAMAKGAVWLQRGRGRPRRLRRATTELRANDRVAIHYDRQLLARTPPAARCVLDRGRYSVWYKPPGLATQGTLFGDHCTLLRQVEKAGPAHREALPVHRLDREAAGLVLVAHDRDAAARLSKLFQDGAVRKEYRVRVRGDLAAAHGAEGMVELTLDGRGARTGYRVMDYDGARDVSTVAVRLYTGRRHQIRRHCDALGHPVLGDPRYGRGNKDPAGLQLVACALAFACPFGGKPVELALTPAEIGW